MVEVAVTMLLCLIWLNIIDLITCPIKKEHAARLQPYSRCFCRSPSIISEFKDKIVIPISALNSAAVSSTGSLIVSLSADLNNAPVSDNFLTEHS